MIQITKMAGLSSRLRGDESSKKSLKGWLIQFSLILLILTGSINANGQALKYVGSTPSDGSIVQSLNTVELNFDISDIISSVGEGDWGICQNGFYVASLPQMEKSATLYKGTKDDGEVIERISTVCKPNNESFEIGNTSKFIFSEFELQAAQVYTLVITYEFYAGKKGEKTWDTTTKLSFQNDPLVLTFYGASQTKKVLSLDSSSIDESQTYEKIKDVKINFNYYVTVNNDIKVTVFEGNNEIVTSSTVEVDPEDGKSIIVKFPETPIYLGHSYNIVIPAEGVSIADEEDITNPEITIPVKGGSYLYFGIGRGLNPSDGSVSILDEITVPFRFPASDTKTYGIMDTGVPMTVYVYSGENTEGEELMRIEGNASTDGTSLVISPNYAFEPESEYTFVIPEGTIDVYDLGARNPSIQEEFVNERIELHYYTPSVDDLPKWHPTPMNVKNNEEISELKYFILDCPEYEYDEVKYNIVFNKNYEGERKDAALYKVTDTGEEELVVFNVTLKTLNANSEIGNGELDGSYFVGEVNQTLYEGNQYKLVWFANKFIVNNPFIGKYVGNPEISVTLKGATPTVNDFGLKANVADRLHSHADVFSFVTESEVMAGENAKMILKDGEDNVAEAPVYISREANGHRVYADFGGKKLESGKNYDVVLPEGSVYSADGIVNNPEIKSVITAMPEAPAAPEFVSIALNIDEYASATYRMVKGEESVLNLKAGDDWKLESLSLDGEDVTADIDENGLYTLPALDKDAALDARYAYAHNVDYDFTTGVGEIEECPYTISKDAEHLVISGLKGGEQIAVYTMGGMKVADLPAVPEDMNTASIALPEGQVYIVMINGISIKYKH